MITSSKYVIAKMSSITRVIIVYENIILSCFQTAIRILFHFLRLRLRKMKGWFLPLLHRIGSWKFAIAGGFFGMLAWSFEQQGIWGLLWILPCFVLWGKSATRRDAFYLWFGYFLGTVHGIPAGASQFFDYPLAQSITLGIVFWIIHAAILASPFLLFSGMGFKPPIFAFSCITFILATLVYPPIGFALWGHPLAVSGVLYPELKWFGLFLTLLLAFLLVQSRYSVKYWKISVAVLLLVCIFANTMHTPPTLPTGWMGLNTKLGKPAQTSSENPYTVFERHVTLQNQIETQWNSNTKIILLPENIAGSWSEIETKLWQDWLQLHERENLAVIIGAHLPAGQSGHYHNALVILDAENQKAYHARLSMPVGNVNPLSSRSATIAPFASPVMDVHGQKVAWHICYEGALAWSILHSMWYNPDILVFAGNVWWAENTNLPVALTRHQTAWTRLFGKPVLQAINQ